MISDIELQISPPKLCKLFQNSDVNLRSQSEVILTGTPRSRTISRIYNCANLSQEKVNATNGKCTNLVGQSMITEKTSCPLGNLGSPYKKPIMIFVYFHTGIGIGFNNPPNLLCSTFTCLQFKYHATYYALLTFIPGHR